MSSKRVLTGGTGDVNPQYLMIHLLQTAANTYTEVEYPIPVRRMAMPKGRCQIIEILKVLVGFAPGDFGSATVAPHDYIYESQITTRSFASMVFLNDPNVIHYHKKIYSMGASADAYWEDPITCDLTDGAAHGLIVASQSLYFGVNTAGQAAAINADCRILYRFKNVGLGEFVGLAIQNQ